MRVTPDVRQHYASKKRSFSLRTESNAGALRVAQSITRYSEDYKFGLRLQGIDIPPNHLVNSNHMDDDPPLIFIVYLGYKI